ncbi:PDGLE domain-containing protein [Parafrankia elaeagni]|uniref:PDGLE domain-containing protein n=1 Tax=Parafrankia elaeagni TaxID=222534 RepID=UPI0003758BBA|nr:PDGLE domain-containing protein [Parafrankia elaeagni]
MTDPHSADRGQADPAVGMPHSSMPHSGGAHSGGADPAVGTPRPAGPAGPAGGVLGDRRNMVFLVAGLFVALVLAGFVSGYASSSPDGLEKVAEDKGFIQQAEDHSFADWPLADYAVSGIENERLAGAVAGVIGVSISYVVGAAVVLGITRLRVRSRAALPADVDAGAGDRVVVAGAGSGAGPAARP